MDVTYLLIALVVAMLMGLGLSTTKYAKLMKKLAIVLVVFSAILFLMTLGNVTLPEYLDPTLWLSIGAGLLAGLEVLAKRLGLGIKRFFRAE